MKIQYNSTPENYFKEKSGRKSNTFRLAEEADPRAHEALERMKSKQFGDITITCRETQDLKGFTRHLTDISLWSFNGQRFLIFSWRPE